MMNLELVITILKLLGASVVGGIITYVTAFSKMKKEQRAKIIGKTMEQRRDALVEIKDIISELSIFERVDITHPESEFNKPFLYHHVFSDFQTFNEFHEKISQMRKKYDQQIDGKLFIAIVKFEHYLMYLLEVINIGFNHEKSAVYTVGVAIFEEVNKWFKETTWLIDKELNKPRYKYKKKYGLIHNIRLKIMNRQLKRTSLYKIFVSPMKLDDNNIGKIFKVNII